MPILITVWGGRYYLPKAGFARNPIADCRFRIAD